mmetsp:Transcript_18852/g.71357  ORF Transcript_18852/g.71357 Transcript_18852/m.71357 type:complete len:243 (-) Transcript_18852:969-1697(-)
MVQELRPPYHAAPHLSRPCQNRKLACGPGVHRLLLESIVCIQTPVASLGTHFQDLNFLRAHLTRRSDHVSNGQLEEHRAGSDEDDIDHSCVHVHDCSRLRVQGRRVDGESAAIGGLLLARSQQGTDVPSPGLGAGTRAVGCVWRCSKREVADRFANRSLRLGFREGPKLSHIELDLLSALVRQKSCESGHHRVGLGVEDAHERRSQAVSRGDDGLGRKMPQNDGASVRDPVPRALRPISTSL